MSGKPTAKATGKPTAKATGKPTRCTVSGGIADGTTGGTADGSDRTELRKRASEVVEILKTVYPKAVCALEWGGQNQETVTEEVLSDSWKLLIMGRLSAQCTDARVNIVSEVLFRRFHSPKEVAEAEVQEIEEIIRPCGLFHTKAANIRDACRILVEDYGGIVPDDREALLLLPGVGRKIANLLLGDIYGEPVIVTDTHCIRICGRLGFYPESLKDPYRIEKILSEVVEPKEQSDFCHRIVQFGRDVCMARSPSCTTCPLNGICPHAKTAESRPT